MDPLELLRLEAETIWGREAGGLGCGTVFATATTFDGRTELLDGHPEITPETPAIITAARCWILTPPARLPSAPPGLALVHDHRDLRAPTGWDPDEWRLLLAGERGPWAALVDDDDVVSLARCARLTERAAEVGVRTQDAYQGRGLASIVVRAWAKLVAADGRVLFYSALADNHASHRVAAKCGAEPLGLLCRLGISPTP
ncbi:GNAT family N-acetyltransferase [Actinocrispum sp. NPDC049592]|uniref:GNAT family N-acetyltransferase n=1 Tax=Actinocrispum sp. NPDC049592 TaxID=3154835 RepID=UPI003420AA2F